MSDVTLQEPLEGALAELAALRPLTHALASGDPPVEVLAQVLERAAVTAGASRAVLLVSREQAEVLTPDSRRNPFDHNRHAELVTHGDLADQIRDWEGSSEPILSSDGMHLIVPLPQGGLALEAPAASAGWDPTSVLTLTVLGDLARAVVGMAMQLHEAGLRARKLEQTRRRLQEQASLLRELAVVDELTGLYNRRFFERRLTYEVDRFARYHQDLALVLFDVDHFKRINDTYGHPAGDAVLKELAARARQAVRASDLVARVGGEEFGVLMPETDLVGAIEGAERLREAIAVAPFDVGDAVVEVTISLGVTLARDGWEGDTQGLFRAADRALYEAKAGGRNRVVTSDDM